MRIARGLLGLVGLTLVVVASAACGGDGNGKTTPTGAVGSPSANIEATPTPQWPSQDGYPLSYRTGVDDIDRVLSILETRNVDKIQSLLAETPSPCVVNPQGITNPPACATGIPAGTMVPVFRATACESVWPGDLQSVLKNWAARERMVYAVYRDPVEAYHWLPSSQYAVVLKTVDGPDGGNVVRISNGRITGWEFGCGPQQAEMLLQGVNSSQYVLAPPTASAPPRPTPTLFVQDPDAHVSWALDRGPEGTPDQDRLRVYLFMVKGMVGGAKLLAPDGSVAGTAGVLGSGHFSDQSCVVRVPKTATDVRLIAILQMTADAQAAFLANPSQYRVQIDNTDRTPSAGTVIYPLVDSGCRPAPPQP